MEVLERFGACSLNAYEVQNLKDLVVQSPLWGSRTFLRLPPMLGVQLSQHCIETFKVQPLSYVVTPADIVSISSRVKHNLNLLDFSEAQVLSVQAGTRKVYLTKRVRFKITPLGTGVYQNDWHPALHTTQVLRHGYVRVL